MSLEIVTLREISAKFLNACSVSMTADLKLVSVLTVSRTLEIFHIEADSNSILKISDVLLYAWQEDVLSNQSYKIMCINTAGDVVCFDIHVNDSTLSVSLDCPTKWNTKTIFQNFLSSLKDVREFKATGILKFESKETVISYNGRYLITCLLSDFEDPRIISFADICEADYPARKISQIKESVFVLNHDGTVLSAYNISTNSKFLELDLSKNRFSSGDSGTIKDFIVSLEKDVIVFHTENSHVYYSVLADGSASSFYDLAPSPSVVTAFTKQFPSVQPVNDNFRRSCLSTSSENINALNLAKGMKNMKIDHMALYNGKLFYLLRDDDCAVIGIYHLGTEHGTVLKRLEGQGFIVTGNSETFPLLLYHNNKLSLVLYDVEHNKLVNELMMYQCGRTAESLSRLNHWQNIHINVDALKQGLRNRQLDAIKFFLKTHEESFNQLLSQKNQKVNIAELKRQCASWIEIMDLLLSTISKTISDVQAHSFVKESLRIAIAFSIHLLNDLSIADGKNEIEEVAEEKRVASLYFSNCLRKLRDLMNGNLSNETSDDDTFLDINIFDEDTLDQYQNWDLVTDFQSIIEDSLLNGNSALAQSYFLNHKDYNMRQHGTLDYFQKVGFQQVNRYLKEKDIPAAVLVLSNLGVSVNNKLHDILKNTWERETRRNLKKELMNRNLLTGDDDKLLSYASVIEKLYPCSSFLHAQQLQKEKSINLYEWQKCSFKEMDAPDLVVGDLVDSSWSNSETGDYCLLKLQWLSLWDDDIKERIVVPQFLKGQFIDNVSITPTSVWNYLLEHGDSTLVLKWISNWSGTLAVCLNEFPYGWKISIDMIDSVSRRAPAHVAEIILNELAKYGVFCTEEQESTPKLISRLEKSQCNLDNPMTFSSGISTITLDELFHKIVHYCLEKNFMGLLFKFSAKFYSCLASWPICGSCDVPLVKMLQAFCCWMQNPEDQSLAFNAMVTTAEQIYSIAEVSFRSLLQKVPSPINIAISLFSSASLRDTVENAKFSQLDVSSMQCTFRSYPMLFDGLFQNQDNCPLPQLTVYQMLQGNCSFDVSKLFGWHSAHLIKSDDALNEMPHFLMSELCSRYGLKETLTHFYYIIEGRPNFAYLKFIAQELVSGNQISYSRIRFCCKQVLSFALSNFTDVKVCSSCIMFLEMLGQDSLPLRTCLVNANTLYIDQYRKSESEESKDKIFQEISLLFQKALEDKGAAHEVIGFLEAEIMQKTQYSESNHSLSEDIIAWMPVVMLANFYDVPIGDSYLSDCAKEDDWFKLLVFAQIFQLPKEQVMKVLPKFTNSCISNHLMKALETKQPMPGQLAFHSAKAPTQKKRDLRKSLYSRIGVYKDITEGLIADESANSVPEIDDETVSLCSLDTTTSSDTELGSILIAKDLFLQLLYSHKTDIPWITLLQAALVLHNPVLSILAASYQEVDILCSFTIWLMTSLPKNNSNKCTSDDAFTILTTWTEEDLEKLVVLTIQQKRIQLLNQGMATFFPESPLCILMEYLVSFLVHKKFEQSLEKLQEFQVRLSEHKDNSFQTSKWIENLTSAILKQSVIICTNSYEREKFLLQLSSQKLFRIDTSHLDFTKLYRMVQCLKSIKVPNIEDFLQPSSSPEYKSACWQGVKNLLQNHLYKEAEKFTSVAALPLDKALLLQVEHESEEIQKKEEWQHLKNRISFWKKVVAIMKKNNLKPEIILDFLRDKCETSDRYSDRCYLMQLMISNYKQSNTKIDLYEVSKLTRNMWFWFIQEVQLDKLSVDEFDALLPKSNKGLFEKTLHLNQCLDDKKAIKALEKIINSLLAKKELHQAFEVANIFNHECFNLKIIKLCLDLARGDIDPVCVDVDKIEGSTPTASPRKKSVVAWASSFQNDSSNSQTDVISLLQKLCEKSEICAPICEQILVNYSVACVLNRLYDEISSETDVFVTLKNILSSKCKDKFTLARSLITVREVPDEEVSAFLSSEIHSSVVTIVENAVLLPENRAASVEEDDIIYNPASSDETFQLTVKLCQDPSLLGRKLMDMVTSRINDFEVAANTDSLFIMVELCICAHNCFSAACNVDGIAQVLHKSKKLVNFLTESRKFSLMVNLLTGIGRYGEMNYVFDKLHEHNQIESQLLKRRMRKVPHLKLALLDYLKRCPSSDNYYSALVHSFNMEREIAQDREISARKNLALFCKDNSDPHLKKKLTDVMKDLVAAAENYCQADCLLQAQLCAELVNLIALQVHLFDSGTWIIGLDDSSVARYIKECNQFSEAVIIADAYRHHQSWTQAVFHNVLVEGDRNYFWELQSHLGVTESLIEDVAKAYNLLPNKNVTQVKNMKWILSHCQNVELKYNLAKQLSFDDVVDEMNNGENAAFLQDLIATTLKK